MLILIFTSSIAAQSRNISDDASIFGDFQDIQKDIEYLNPVFPCTNNSSGEKLVYDFIKERLTTLKIEYDEQQLDSIRGEHSFSTNIIADFKGATASEIIIAVPINNLDNNSFNIAIALKMCSIFKTYNFYKSIKIIFAGAEFLPIGINTPAGVGTIPAPDLWFKKFTSNTIVSESRGSLLQQAGIVPVKEQLGTRVFLQEYFPESDAVAIYLNIKNENDIIELRGSSKEGQAPLWLLKQAYKELGEKNINFFINTNEIRLFKAGYNAKSNIDYFLENNIPAVYISSGENHDRIFQLPGNRKYEEQKNLTEKLVMFLTAMADSASSLEWERNYAVMHINNRYIFIGERYLILFYIVSAVILLLFAFIYKKNLLKYLKRFIKNLHYAAWLFFLCFIFLFLATIITEFIISRKGTENIWLETLFAVLLMKIAITFVFFFFSIFIFRRISNFIRYIKHTAKINKISHNADTSEKHNILFALKHPRNEGTFYTAGAIFITLINVFIFQFIDIILPFTAIWALIWVMLFSFVKNRIVKILCMVVSYAFILNTVIYIFMLPAVNICKILILNKLEGNLLIAAFILPMTLMILRIFKNHGYIKRKIENVLKVSAFFAVTGFAAAISVYFYKIDIYKDKEIPVFVLNRIDTDSRLSYISAFSQLNNKDLPISINNKNYEIKNGKYEDLFAIDENNALVDIKKNLSWFLDRKNLVVDIIPAGKPVKIDISFKLGKNQIILDSNYQFLLDDDFNEGFFDIGYNPDFPFTLDILLDRNSNIELDIRILYLEPPFDFVLSGEHIDFTTCFVVKKIIYG